MTARKRLEFRFQRSIPASPSAVYKAWLDPKTPGTIWSIADRLLLTPKVDGFYYVSAHEMPHYGRFTAVQRPTRLQHTWVSPNTDGEETTVTVTFDRQGNGTLMTLVHSGLPNTEGGRAHEDGWNHFLGIFPQQFGDRAVRDVRVPGRPRARAATPVR
jgi:uncharacterized protein YndB with AHSA1/START domain